MERNAIRPEHFTNWVAWAKAQKLGLDFNPSCFSHPLSADGFTLSHANDEIRQFWIDHVKACRRVSAWFGEQLGTVRERISGSAYKASLTSLRWAIQEYRMIRACLRSSF